MEFLENLLYAVITAAIPVLITFACNWLTMKSKALKDKIAGDAFDRTIDAVNNIICDAVLATTQTYVDALKVGGLFDANAQKEAFEKTKTAVLAQLTDESKNIIISVYGDLNTYLTSKIEATVKAQK